MEIRDISIDEAPETLQKAINDCLESWSKYGGGSLLVIEAKIDTPYQDKTKKFTNYTAFIEYGNLLATLRYEPDLSPKEVMKNSMIIGEIATFIKHSRLMKMTAKDALKE